MLSSRAETILKSLIDSYIERGIPVSSQSLVKDMRLGVCSATVRNDMASLEVEGYIAHPHTSAGSVPTDKGYRFYVASLEKTVLPLPEQRMISHLFHQVEEQLDQWLSLAAAIMAQFSKNTAIVTIPKPEDCQFRHLEAVVLRDNLVLAVLVLRGARIKQHLVTLPGDVPEAELTAIADRLSAEYAGLAGYQISARPPRTSAIEQALTDSVVKMMQVEDEQEFTQCYLEGLNFLMCQPEFAGSQHIIDLIELLQNKKLLLNTLPRGGNVHDVEVVIGNENKAAAIRNCGVVIGRYGLPDEAVGTIGVIGPTRMQYARIISVVSYLSMLLSGLVAELYGARVQTRYKTEDIN